MNRKMIKAFLLQLQFLTRIRVSARLEFDEDIFARGIIFSPVIGFIIGLVIGGIYYLIFFTVGKQIPAFILAVAAEIILTGGLHLDGLADTFDGIFSNRSREDILEIMKDSRIGTSGALALILVIIVKIGLLLSVSHSFILPCLFLMPAVSRMNIAWSAGISGYARSGNGTAGKIIKSTGIKEILIASLITVVLCMPFLRLLSLIAIIVSILFAVLFTVYVKKKIGGITGDIIGAVIELTEIVFLFSMLIAGSIDFTRIYTGLPARIF